MSSTVLFCGSRSWTEWRPVFEAMAKLPPATTVVQGGADEGGDRVARECALCLGLRLETTPANWRGDGTQAGGSVRNGLMLDVHKPARVFAYWDGRSGGTRDMIAQARMRGIPVEVHYGGGRCPVVFAHQALPGLER